MKTNEIKKLLEGMIGLDFKRHWAYGNQAYDALKSDLAKILNIDKDDLYKVVRYNADPKTHLIEFTYKGHYWFRLTGKKKKGETHHRWYGSSYCDWTIKDIEVLIYSYAKDPVAEDARTLEDAIPYIEDRVHEENAKKDTTEQRCIEAIKFIVNTYGTDSWETIDLINTLYRTKYSLVGKVIKELESKN